MKLDFFKMHAQGNDYIYFDHRQKNLPDLDLQKLAKRLSRRHFSIGADGIVIIEPGSRADAAMRIFNADGSEGEMCGSAVQCIISYLSRQEKRKTFSIETASGIRTGLVIENSKKIRICLGKPILKQDEYVTIAGFNGKLIDLGNSHFVVYATDLELIQTETAGKTICLNEQFADGINVEFIEIISRREVKLKVWERGSGVTLFCGTGSGAAVFAGISDQLLDHSVLLHSPGGEVEVDYDGTDVFLTGEVEFVFKGEVEL